MSVEVQREEYWVLASPLNIGSIDEGEYIAVSEQTYRFLQKVTGVQNVNHEMTKLYNEQGVLPNDVKGVGLYEIVGTNPHLDEQLTQEVYANYTYDELYDLIYVKLTQKPQDKAGATETLAKAFTARTPTYVTREDSKSEVWVYKDGVYVPNGKTYIEEFCRNVLGRRYTKKLSLEVVDKIVADNYVDAEQFFSIKDPYRLALQNGVYDFNDNKLHPFNPNEIHFNKINVCFDEDATCPNILKFVRGIVRTDDEANLLLEMISFTLIKDYFLEKAFMLLGVGRNGKGKLFKLIGKLLGEKNYVNISLSDLEKDAFVKGNLHNMMANLGADISDTPIKKSGQFKELTGRDKVGANRKFKNHVYFENYAKMLYSCNDLPITHDKSQGFFNRWILIEFPYQFLAQNEIDSLYGDDVPPHVSLENPSIIKEIASSGELNGLFNVCVKKLIKLRQQNSFTYSNNSHQVQQLWVTKSDSLTGFFEFCLVDTVDATVDKKTMRLVYNLFCRKNKVERFSDVRIKKFFDTKGVVSEESKSHGSFVSRWRNVELDMSSDKVIELLEELKIKVPEFTPKASNSDAMDRIKKTIQVFPNNNETLLVAAFGQRLVAKLAEEGALMLTKPGTYMVV